MPDNPDLFVPRAKFTLDELGREVPDPVPVAPPVGYVRQKSLVEQIREMIRSEKLRDAAVAGGYETFEEADDFEVGEDFEPSSPYEGDFEPVADINRDIMSAADKAKQDKLKKAVEAAQEPAPEPPAPSSPPKPAA